MGLENYQRYLVNPQKIYAEVLAVAKLLKELYDLKLTIRFENL